MASTLLAATSAHAAEGKARPLPITDVTPPEALPALTYVNGEGKSVAPEFAHAKLTVLHFWATWCVPCVQELPEVDEAQKQYQSRGLQVLPLTLDGAKMDRIRDYYKLHKIEHLPLAYDANSAALRSLKGVGVPISIFVNSKGEEVGRAAGVVAWRDQSTLDFIDKHLK